MDRLYAQCLTLKVGIIYLAKNNIMQTLACLNIDMRE